ncbi:MAG: efflux transporter outer membrane subunit [Rhodoferax sp.]
MAKPLQLALSGLALALTACSFAPTYESPVSPVPATWPTGAAYPQTSEAASAMDWPTLLPDVRLQQLVGRALGQNRDLRLAVLAVERAQGLYGIQRDSRYPTLNAQAAGSRQQRAQDLIQPGQDRLVGQYSVDLGTAAWEIDFFGRIRSLSAQALEQYLATDEARRGAQLALIAQVARAYLTLAADRELQALAQRTVQSQQAAVALVHRRVEAGLANELDLQRAQVPLESARGELARATQRVAQDRNALDLLVGAPVEDALLPSSLAEVTPPKAVRAGLSSEVLLRRPDVMAAEHQLKAAYANIGAARAALFPRISLTATLGTASNQLSGLFGAGNGTWLFAPQAALPIFDARLRAAVQVSQTEREIVLAQYEKTVQTAFREVADALATQGTLEAQREAQQAVVEASRNSLHLAMRRSEQGLDSYLSVLDAQRSLFAAEQALVAMNQAKMLAQVGLYTVLGGAG